MFKVEYAENGKAKESREFATESEAFAFQSGLIAARRPIGDGKYDIELGGVYDLTKVGTPKP